MNPPACPVEDDVRRWVEARMQWLVKEFGEDRLRSVTVVTPTTEFFPDRWNRTEVEVQELAKRIAGYMGLGFETIEVYAYDNPAPLDGMSVTQAAGTYQESDGRFWIGYDRKGIDDPLQLAATLAHEFAHIHLLGHRRVGADTPDHELLTDLCALATGLGVIVANAAVQEYVDRQGAYVSSGVGRSGYLDLRTFGYAFAVFAHVRNEVDPSWTKHLRRDVRTTMRQGRRLLDAVGLSSDGPEEFSPPESLKSRTEWAVEFTEGERDRIEDASSAESTCHYCGRRAPKFFDDQDRPICRACHKSILENYDEVVAAHHEAEHSTRRMLPIWKLALWLFIAFMIVMSYLDATRR